MFSRAQTRGANVFLEVPHLQFPTVHSVIGSDEYIVWSGRPKPQAFTPYSILAFGMGLIYGLLGYACLSSIISSINKALSFSGIALIIFSLIFVVLAVYYLSAPYRYASALKRLEYYVTNQKIIIFYRTFLGQRTLSEYTRDDFFGMVHYQRRYGNLQFDFLEEIAPWEYSCCFVPFSSKGISGSFVNLQKSEQVEKLIFDTFFPDVVSGSEPESSYEGTDINLSKQHQETLLAKLQPDEKLLWADANRYALYGITQARAVILQLSSDARTWSFPRERLTDSTFHLKKAGYGDVILFQLDLTRTTHSPRYKGAKRASSAPKSLSIRDYFNSGSFGKPTWSTEIGFFNIREPKKVATILRRYGN